MNAITVIRASLAAARRGVVRLVGGLLLSLSVAVPAAAAPTDEAAEQAAMAVMERFLAAFNDRDPEAWADTLLFPHVRLASQTVAVYQTRTDFVAAMDFDRLALETGWDYSAWDQMKIVQSGADKVHVAVTFIRYSASGEALASYQSLYIIERVDGRWGVRARSSFAP